MIKMIITLHDGQQIKYDWIGERSTAPGRARKIAKEGFWAEKGLFITSYAIKSVKVV